MGKMKSIMKDEDYEFENPRKDDWFQMNTNKKGFSVNSYSKEDEYECNYCHALHIPTLRGTVQSYQIFQHTSPVMILYTICPECYNKIGKVTDEKSFKKLLCIMKVRYGR